MITGMEPEHMSDFKNGLLSKLRNSNGDFTQEALMALFEYRDNRLIFKKRPMWFFENEHGAATYEALIGKPSGSIKRRGKERQVCYRRLQIMGVNVYEHRAVYIYLFGEIPEGMEVDHIDGDGLNNSVKNLRLVSHKENMKNMAVGAKNKSGICGVALHASGTKWRAYITQ